MQQTLSNIQALTEETRALVRAGMPLEGVSGSTSGQAAAKLNELIGDVQKKSAEGQSIEQIIDAASGSRRILTAGVAAGLSSGRLSQCLEMLGDVASDVLHIRRRIYSALLYPCVILLAASFLFAIIVRQFLYRVSGSLEVGRQSFSPALTQLLEWDRDYAWWPWLVPGCMLAFLLLPFLFPRKGLIGFRGPQKLLLLIPGVHRLLANLQFYTATRTFGLMVDHGVPLPDCLVIAGACSEKSQLNSAFREAAKLAEKGELEHLQIDRLWKAGRLPPLLSVALKHSRNSEQQLKLTLKSVTGHYHRRLESGMVVLRQYLPLGITVFLAGTAVLLFALSVFWPLTEFYAEILNEADLTSSTGERR